MLVISFECWFPSRPKFKDTVDKNGQNRHQYIARTNISPRYSPLDFVTLGDFTNDISHVGWFQQAMKDDEVHEIDNEFDTAVMLLDRLATNVDGRRRKH